VPDAGLEEVAERLRGLVGTAGAEQTATVRARDFQRFAIAVGDEDPRVFDAVAPVAPAMFLPATIEWGTGPPIAGLRADGTGADRDAWLPLDGLRLMGGGQELELGDDVVDGTTFTARPTLQDVTLREGRSGPLLLLRLRTEFRTPQGRLLVASTETILARPLPAEAP
jgi:hypothetical protein